MVRHHWLDPFARQVLRVTGQLPTKKVLKNKQIEYELKLIKSQKLLKKINQCELIDVNRSRPNDWTKLPGCTHQMIELLMRLQRGGVQLSGIDDLKKLLGLSNKLSEEWKPYLSFNWYGDSPPLLELPSKLDINCASKASLNEKLQWPIDRVKRLLRERQREPFADLADLQERLVLPPTVIEELIGIVSFGPRVGGPELPPKS